MIFMKSKIAVFGNTSFGNGQFITAALTLAGYTVNFCELPELEEKITPIKDQGGIYLEGDTEELLSRKTGLAKPNMITTDIEKAFKDVNIIFMDLPHFEYENRIKAIAPYLEDGQIINFNSYGYWPSLRVNKIIQKANKKNIILTESPAASYIARGKSGNINFIWARKKLPLATFPAEKSKEAFDILNRIFPNYIIAKNVLETNFENINFLAHTGFALPNIGNFDNAEEKGEGVDFYKIANTYHTGLFTEAKDKERINVCKAYNLTYRSLISHINNYYAAPGETIQEAFHNLKLFQGRLISAGIWRKWVKLDIALSHIPFVLLAELAGASVPLHRGIIAINGAVLGIDFWKTGLTLDKLGLEGLTSKEVMHYVTYGEYR
jgi:opine dehydrogenase